jgi:hypothetical protein
MFPILLTKRRVGDNSLFPSMSDSYILCGSYNDCALTLPTAASVQDNYDELFRVEVICGNNDVTFEWQALLQDILVYQFGYECTDPDGTTVSVPLAIVYNLLCNTELGNNQIRIYLEGHSKKL